jgi:hypothetical protein
MYLSAGRKIITEVFIFQSKELVNINMGLFISPEIIFPLPPLLKKNFFPFLGYATIFTPHEIFSFIFPPF